VDAWRINPALLVSDPNASTVGSTFIRVVWSGGITDYPTGNEVGVDVTQAYRLTYLYQGKIASLTPLDIGDLNDGDNMHDLSFPEIPADAKLLSIILPNGYVEDPNGDPNPSQSFRLKSSSSEDAPTLKWRWRYETPKNFAGAKIKARGTLITDTDPDADGYFNAMSIKGKRNGGRITGLYPAGTSIPGNTPYAGDNLIDFEKTTTNPRLTKNGLQFLIEDGSYSYVFFADFLESPRHLEYHSLPPYTEGPFAPNSETSVSFQISLIT